VIEDLLDYVWVNDGNPCFQTRIVNMHRLEIFFHTSRKRLAGCLQNLLQEIAVSSGPSRAYRFAFESRQSDSTL